MVRAFRLTLVRLLVFYLLTLGLMMAIIPWYQASVKESPFVLVMEATRVPGAASLLNFVVLVAARPATATHVHQIEEAMRDLANGHACGKIVITMEQADG